MPDETCGQQLGIVTCETNKTDHHDNSFQWQMWSSVIEKRISQVPRVLETTPVEYSEITTKNIHNMNEAKIIRKKYSKHGMIPV